MCVLFSGQAELEHRVRVVTLLHRHLKVILWFVHNSLLPENDGERWLFPYERKRERERACV
jgi:hypothetical protein